METDGALDGVYENERRILENLSERSLMELWLKERDEGAVVELIGRYEKPLYAFLRNQTNSSTAWDLYQELMLKVLYLPEMNYEDISHPKSWFFRMAVNVLRDYLRYKKRRPELELKTEFVGSGRRGPDGDSDDAEISRRLHEALASLSEPERQAFVLVRLSGLSYREAADVLGVQISALKMRLMRGHQHLTELLDDLK